MTDRFQSFFQLNFPLAAGQKVLLAVSGGMDSVVLCDLTAEARLPFSIAHCNFGLRGAESDRDEQFVRHLAAAYGAELMVRKFDTESFSRTNKLSVQEAARELRYQWFGELMAAGDYAFTLLAHHADDNIETVLMHFFRGTGLEGLTGMKEKSPRGNFLRPMLSFTRREIEQYADQRKLKWVEDSSNSSSKYTRNYFRNELIPALKKVFPQTEQNILDSISRFRNIHTLHQYAVGEVKKKLVERNGSEVRIPVQKLIKLDNPALIYEIIRDYGFGEKAVGEVRKLLHTEPGRFLENESFQIIRHRAWILIAPKSAEAGVIAIPEGLADVPFMEGHIQIQHIHSYSGNPVGTQETAHLDASEIEFPILLRRWKQGDYFYPFGMRKKKKIARFLIDQKMSKNLKEKVWVLESAKRIIWVVGLRIDDRFRITSKTRSVLKITYQRKVVKG